MFVRTLSYSLSVAAVSGAMALTNFTPTAVDATELKLGTFVPPQHLTQRVMFGPMAKELAAKTGGDLTIKMFPSGQLGKGPVQQYKRVLENAADITFGIQSYSPTLFPRTMLVGTPHLWTAEEATIRLWNIFEPHLQKEYGKVKVIALFTAPPNVVLSKSKKIRTMADMKGLKIRASGRDVSPLLKSWGGVPVVTPINQVYRSMDTGLIDLAFVPVAALIRPWNLHEQTTAIAVGMPNPVNPLFALMNKRVWDGLTKKQQEALDSVSGRELSLKGARAFDALDQKAVAFAKKSGKIDFHELSASARADFQKGAAVQIEAQLSAAEKRGDKNARKVYADLLK